MSAWLKSAWSQLAFTFVLIYIGSFGLYLYTYVFLHLRGYLFLPENAVLALIPLLLAGRLIISLRHKRWSDWEPMLLTLLYFVFIPASFYATSDYVHLQGNTDRNILLTSVLFSSFIIPALFNGLASLYLLHSELKKRIRFYSAGIIMTILLIGICFSVYVGRDLGWNNWEIFLHPLSFFMDISNLFSKSGAYANVARSISALFILMGSLYLLSWRMGRLIWHRGINDLAAHIKRAKSS